MEKIHFKTVDPLGQELLLKAAGEGLSLKWERFESQQPQDGFLRLGLSCPIGCLEGPCRIDPFGRGAAQGICGLNREGMAAAFLLRVVLQGTLEAWAGEAFLPADKISWPPALRARVEKVENNTGGRPISPADILMAAALLARPGASTPDLIRLILRLGVLSLLPGETGSGEPSPRQFKTGYGLLAGDGIYIALMGKIPEGRVNALGKEAARWKNPAVSLISLGDWIPAGEGYLPLVCTTGEAEGVLASGKVCLLVSGSGVESAVLALAEKLNIPILDAGAPLEEILAAAQKIGGAKPASSFCPEASLVSSGSALVKREHLDAFLREAPRGRLAAVGGSDTVHRSLGHLPGELAKALQGEDFRLASWGDGALWLAKQDISAAVLEPRRGPQMMVEALAAADRMADLAGVCFTGVKELRELAQLVGLAALGTKVGAAFPLPLGGSEKAGGQLREELALLGGSLTHFDHDLGGEDFLAWIIGA